MRQVLIPYSDAAYAGSQCARPHLCNVLPRAFGAIHLCFQQWRSFLLRSVLVNREFPALFRFFQSGVRNCGLKCARKDTRHGRRRQQH